MRDLVELMKPARRPPPPPRERPHLLFIPRTRDAFAAEPLDPFDLPEPCHCGSTRGLYANRYTKRRACRRCGRSLNEAQS